MIDSYRLSFHTPHMMGRMDSDKITSALSSVERSLSIASEYFDYYVDANEPAERDDVLLVEDALNAAFLKLLVLLDRLGLERTYIRVSEVYTEARNDLLREVIYDGDRYLHWRSILLNFVDAVRATENVETPSTVSKDIESILRGCTNAITDSACFTNPPCSETDVHVRIEAVLRCVFPDLKTKPTLTKPIKNFQPDTGLPSIRTLIEYKFLSNPTDATRVVDEILADTRGYHSAEWKHLIYVIYETKRFKTEHAWRSLLRECGVENATAVVLPGEDRASQRSVRPK